MNSPLPVMLYATNIKDKSRKPLRTPLIKESKLCSRTCQAYQFLSTTARLINFLAQLPGWNIVSLNTKLAQMKRLFRTPLRVWNQRTYSRTCVAKSTSYKCSVRGWTIFKTAQLRVTWIVTLPSAEMQKKKFCVALDEAAPSADDADSMETAEAGRGGAEAAASASVNTCSITGSCRNCLRIFGPIWCRLFHVVNWGWIHPESTYVHELISHDACLQQEWIYIGPALKGAPSGRIRREMATMRVCVRGPASKTCFSLHLTETRRGPPRPPISEVGFAVTQPINKSE